MYVGGAWGGAASGQTMRVVNPATGEPLAELPDAGREDVVQAIDAAATAFPKWAATPALERGRILRRTVVSGPLTGEASDRKERSESSLSPEGGPIRAFYGAYAS